MKIAEQQFAVVVLVVLMFAIGALMRWLQIV